LPVKRNVKLDDSRVMLLADIAVNRAAFAALAMGLIREGVDTGRIHPAVVEVEQSAHRYGVVNGFVAPTGFVKGPHIVCRDCRRVAVDFRDETKQRFVVLRQPRGFEITKDAAYELFTA